MITRWKDRGYFPLSHKVYTKTEVNIFVIIYLVFKKNKLRKSIILGIIFNLFNSQQI